MRFEKVLIADQDVLSCALLEKLLQKKKSEIFLANERTKASELLHEHVFDLVICDLAFPLSGLHILQIAKKQNPSAVVILTTSAGCVESAVEAMRLGAFNYILKPLSSESIEAMLDRVQEHLDLLQENRYLREEISSQSERKKYLLITESEPMKKLFSDVDKIAKSSSSVFISGESGTGKEVIAHSIHTQSPRNLKPFIKVNCAAIPSTLLESEFFGHEKGAFTGAIQKKLGKFELADKGTLLLDEVSEILPELQSKLLRAVQEMEFERVGGIRPISVDVRLISTSNRSLKEAIEEKLFREDLYYRLNVVPIHLPPLRERKVDILPLADFFLKRLCQENQKPLKRLYPSAKQKLMDYHWPGNIRELANVMERTVVMNATQMIEAHHVYIDLSCPIKDKPSSPFLPGTTLAQMEKKLILETLAQENDNRSKAAQALGISLRTLRNKLRSYTNPQK